MVSKEELKEKFAKEKLIYDLLYGNLILDDFVPIIKHNTLNINVENYVLHDLSFENIIDIMNDDIIKSSKIENKNFLNIASAAGKIVIITAILHNFKNIFGIDNIYEMGIISRVLLN
jgi:hypothetical protein